MGEDVLGMVLRSVPEKELEIFKAERLQHKINILKQELNDVYKRVESINMEIDRKTRVERAIKSMNK